MKNLQVQVVWNRDFNWSNWGALHSKLESAKSSAISIRDSGDGGRVKKVRVVDTTTDRILWNG